MEREGTRSNMDDKIIDVEDSRILEDILITELGGVASNIRSVIREDTEANTHQRQLTRRQKLIICSLLQCLPLLLIEVIRYLVSESSSSHSSTFSRFPDFQIAQNSIQHVRDITLSMSEWIYFLYGRMLQSLALRNVVSNRSGWWVKERSRHWFWGMVMWRWYESDDSRWMREFRMSPGRFRVCVETMRPHITRQTTNLRMPHPPEIRLAVCFMKLAHGLENFDLSEKISVGEATVVDILCQVVPVFNEVYSYQIAFPKGVALRETISKFEEISGMPNVVGAIDCTHFEINKPQVPNSAMWFFKRSYHAIVMQAVCSADRKFLSIFAGLPGTFNDQRVLRVSALYRRAMSGEFFDEDGLTLPSEAPFSPYLIGDRGYMPFRWLISPVKAFTRRGPLTDQELYFNNHLSQARVRVEHAFGILKKTFTHMGRKISMDTNFVPQWVRFACILHNLLIDSKELDFTEVVEEIEEEQQAIAQATAARGDIQRDREHVIDDMEQEGLDKREALIQYMWARRQPRGR